MTFLEATFYGNPVWRWFLALGLIISVWFALHVLLRIVIARLRGFVARIARVRRPDTRPAR